jgi:hypothetical protein
VVFDATAVDIIAAPHLMLFGFSGGSSVVYADGVGGGFINPGTNGNSGVTLFNEAGLGSHGLNGNTGLFIFGPLNSTDATQIHTFVQSAATWAGT